MKKLLTENELYGLLLKDDWQKLVDFLHFNKEDINKDDRLIHIAGLIETEFIRKLKDYPPDSNEILIVLENFYLLNDGGFYKLKLENIEAIYEELALRDPDHYAHFSKVNRQKKVQVAADRINVAKSQKEDNTIPGKWIEIYNRLFEIMDVRGDAETYFSGPRFINLIRKYDRYHPDYIQYIRERELSGYSTTRKVYFEDLLIALSNLNRKKVIDNVLAIIRPYDKERVEEVETLLYGKKPLTYSKEGEHDRKLVVFISYSWDDEAHKSWVLGLANKLTNDGLDVKIDRHSMRLGSNAPYTMEQSIEQADKVLIIFTPGYKAKADQRKGGVGYEYTIMNAALYNNQTINKKIIPVLRIGTKEQSIPAFMQQYIHVDLRNDDSFESNYNDLRHELLTPDT